jgi:hypothetical protein
MKEVAEAANIMKYSLTEAAPMKHLEAIWPAQHCVCNGLYKRANLHYIFSFPMKSNTAIAFGCAVDVLRSRLLRCGCVRSTMIALALARQRMHNSVWRRRQRRRAPSWRK